jgi:hypothetical protein
MFLRIGTSTRTTTVSFVFHGEGSIGLSICRPCQSRPNVTHRKCKLDAESKAGKGSTDEASGLYQNAIAMDAALKSMKRPNQEAI